MKPFQHQARVPPSLLSAAVLAYPMGGACQQAAPMDKMPGHDIRTTCRRTIRK